MEAGITSNHFTLRVLMHYTIGSIGLLALLAYITFQARFLIEGPQIILTEEPPRVENVRTITLTGTAKNIAEISLNGRQIFTDERGHFEEAVVLENGYTIVTIAAVDRYGRHTSVVRPFIYIPASIITQ